MIKWTASVCFTGLNCAFDFMWITDCNLFDAMHRETDKQQNGLITWIPTDNAARYLNLHSTDSDWNVKPIVHLSKFLLLSCFAKTINECENKSCLQHRNATGFGFSTHMLPEISCFFFLNLLYWIYKKRRTLL